MTFEKLLISFPFLCHFLLIANLPLPQALHTVEIHCWANLDEHKKELNP